MSTREELADTIAVALRGEDQFGYTDISDLGDAVLDSRYDLLAVADAVLADYQPKPRTVDNIEDLNAEIPGTVAMFADGNVATAGAEFHDYPGGNGNRVWWGTRSERPLPARILFTPEATA